MLRSSIRSASSAFTAYARRAVTRVTNDRMCNDLLKDPRPTVLHFRKRDCASCDDLNPKLEALASKHQNIQFASVDIDDCKEIAKRFNVKGTPSIAAVNQGQHVDTMSELTDHSLHDFITQLHGQLENEHVTVKTTTTRETTAEGSEVVVETEEITITGDNAKLPERGLANQPAQDFMDHEMAHHNKQVAKEQRGSSKRPIPQITRKKQETRHQTL